MTRGDRGIGLVEVVVVMSLTALALTLFGMAFSAMLRTSDTSQDVGSVTDQLRLALNNLDRQVRFGYWVRDASMTCPSGASCPGIKVLTPDASGAMGMPGALQCWFWVVDMDNGRLLSFHYPKNDPDTLPPLSSGGSSGKNLKWHIEAGSEGDGADDARITAASLSFIPSSLVRPLDATTLQRASYYLAASASFTVVRGERPPATIALQMTVRNQWIGAPYGAAC